MAPNFHKNTNDNSDNNNNSDHDGGGSQRRTETDVGKPRHPTPHNTPTDPKQLLAESNQDAATEIGLLRQLALCAGLLANDGGLVFMQLMMLPTLQTLGVPVTSVTLPGCLSGCMALFGLPLLGCLSDRGDNPRARKKPAVVFSTFVFLVGFSLVISGCGLYTWSRAAKAGAEAESVMGYPGLASFNSSSLLQNDFATTPDGYNVTSDANSSFTLGAGLPSQPHMGGTTLQTLTEPRSSKDSGFLPGGTPHPEGPQPGTSTSAEAVTHPGEAVNLPPSPVEGHDQQPLPGDEKEDEKGSVDNGWMQDPLGLGIPLVGVLSILGFAFVDMGNDLNNSSQKSFVLASARAGQHVSLLVVGVQMSALGGCVAAALGVTDLPSYLTWGTRLDTVPGKTLLQCAIFIVLAVLCVLVTLLAAPSSPLKARDIESPPIIASTSQPSSPSPTKRLNYGTVDTEPRKNLSPFPSHLFAEDALHSSYADSLNESKLSHCCHHDSTNSFFSRLDNSVSDYHLATSCESQLSTATDTARLVTDRPKLHHRSLLHLSHNSNTPEITRRARLLASNSIVYYAIEQNDPDDADCESDGGRSGAEAGRRGLGCVSLSRQSRRLALICCSMFFMCGAWQSFNVCATDYLGKVIFKGDPDAAPDSGAYAAYQQGMRTGSMGVLILNVVYVIANFLQKKMLTTVGPKVECFVVCGLLVGCLVTLLLTDHVVAYYVTSTVFGFFRSTMYTIPFMLANEICQEEASLGAGEGGAEDKKANVGSTMAMVTSMIPLSNILVSSLTGPLIYSTGDPTFPLYYTVGATTLAAVVFVFT